ncbi:hypothetical protein RIF29_37988 [Crotalaria pallida]|uniref:Uncharacterized protein n=1 Tax=Crotalaria pallida TaxID=3830 RepID=A0AAN9DYA6_CROPI
MRLLSVLLREKKAREEAERKLEEALKSREEAEKSLADAREKAEEEAKDRPIDLSSPDLPDPRLLVEDTSKFSASSIVLSDSDDEPQT